MLTSREDSSARGDLVWLKPLTQKAQELIFTRQGLQSCSWGPEIGTTESVRVSSSRLFCDLLLFALPEAQRSGHVEE